MKNILKFFSIILAVGMTYTSALAFTDVPENAWYVGYVNELKDKGIIDDAPLFNPSQNLKRAELVKMVIKAIDGLKDFQAPAFSTFDDVPKDAWFWPYVEEAATRGIVNGYADQEGNFTGFFGPADTVTRGAAVKVLVRAFDLKLKSGTSMNFSDVTTADWFYNDLKIAQSLGIIEGYSDGTFKGNKEVTRSEISKMLSLSMNGGAGEVIIPPTPTPTPPAEEPNTPENPPVGTPAKPNTNPLDDSLTTEGATQKLVARYNFKGNNEGFLVDTVTVVNDLIGSSMGDQAESSLAIKNVTLKYPDKNGFLKTAMAPLKSDGTARFGNLEFFVKREVDSFLEVYVDLNTFAEVGSDLSGESFRIGLKDVGVTTSDFKAVGEFSGDVITFGNGALVSSSSDVPTFTMRKSRPTFEIQTPSATLINGTNSLINFNVTAASTGTVGLGRIVLNLDVSDNDNANLTLSNFKLYSGSDVVDDAVIYDATGGQDLSVGNLVNGTATVIVSFDQQEIVSSGQTKAYHLKADVIGAAQDDSVSTSLASGDENTPLSGLTAYEQENTGKIFVNADATAGIFTGATDFSQTVGVNRNVIWSDFSFEPHQYPQVMNGTVTTGTGSKDWTNGYELGIIDLSASVLSK